MGLDGLYQLEFNWVEAFNTFLNLDDDKMEQIAGTERNWRNQEQIDLSNSRIEMKEPFHGRILDQILNLVFREEITSVFCNLKIWMYH